MGGDKFLHCRNAFEPVSTAELGFDISLLDVREIQQLRCTSAKIARTGIQVGNKKASESSSPSHASNMRANSI